MAHIDYYLATLSPWCYLAGNRLEEIAARHGATIRYRPLDVMQLFDRSGGTRPPARHPNRVAYRMQEILRWSKWLGMPMNPNPTLPQVNMAPSSYAVIAAQEAGQGNIGALVQGFLRARWVEDRDISDDEVIRDVLTSCGFDPEIANKGLFVGAEIYGRNLDDAIDQGVFGVPFYIVRETNERFWGQDRLEFLDRHLAEIA